MEVPSRHKNFSLGFRRILGLIVDVNSSKRDPANTGFQTQMSQDINKNTHANQIEYLQNSKPIATFFENKIYLASQIRQKGVDLKNYDANGVSSLVNKEFRFRGDGSNLKSLGAGRCRLRQQQSPQASEKVLFKHIRTTTDLKSFLGKAFDRTNRRLSSFENGAKTFRRNSQNVQSITKRRTAGTSNASLDRNVKDVYEVSLTQLPLLRAKRRGAYRGRSSARQSHYDRRAFYERRNWERRQARKKKKPKPKPKPSRRVLRKNKPAFYPFPCKIYVGGQFLSIFDSFAIRVALSRDVPLKLAREVEEIEEQRKALAKRSTTTVAEAEALARLAYMTEVADNTRDANSTQGSDIDDVGDGGNESDEHNEDEQDISQVFMII